MAPNCTPIKKKTVDKTKSNEKEDKRVWEETLIALDSQSLEESSKNSQTKYLLPTKDKHICQIYLWTNTQQFDINLSFGRGLKISIFCLTILQILKKSQPIQVYQLDTTLKI